MFNCGVIGKDQKAPYKMHLALIEENKAAFVKVIYRDIYGRLLESKRELIGEQKNWILGPLQTSIILEKGNIS